MATRAQIESVERLVRESVANIDRMAPDALRAVMPALRDARDEMQRGLTEWIGGIDNGANRFTAYERTRALRALEGALGRVEQLEPAMSRALAIGRRATGPLAVENLGSEITRLSSIFGDGLVVMPQLDTAAVIARGDRLLWKRHERSARRYAGAVGEDIRHQFAVGLAKHETFEQLTTRLRRMGGGLGTGLVGDAAGEIADGMWLRQRHVATRLVRTEMMHGYNVQHGEAINAVNDARPDDEDPYLRRWDSAADNVTCPICKELDRTLATIDGEFKGGIKNPPAHPHCRCVVLAWLARWGGFKGETPSLGPTPKAPPRPPPLPRTADDVHEDSVTTVPASKIAKHGFGSMPGTGDDRVKMERARETIAQGQRDPIRVLVSPGGKYWIDDGRHRLQAAIEANAPIKVKWQKGVAALDAPPLPAVPRKEQTTALLDKLGWSVDSSKHIKTPTGDFTESMLKRPGKRRVAVPQSNIVPKTAAVPSAEPPPIVVGEKKNPKRVAAAQKAAAVSAERRREIHSGVASNLSQELQVAWEKEGHKFMQEEAKRVHGVKDRMTASSKLSEAFTEKYGSGHETAHRHEGDRFSKRAEIEAKHADKWADEQERKYYEAMQREAMDSGEISDHGSVTPRGRARNAKPIEWKPVDVDSDDPPF